MSHFMTLLFSVRNVACADLAAVHFLFSCQCCPAWYLGQTLIPGEEEPY